VECVPACSDLTRVQWVEYLIAVAAQTMGNCMSSNFAAERQRVEILERLVASPLLIGVMSHRQVISGGGGGSPSTVSTKESDS
jgi:hypothetical protein